MISLLWIFLATQVHATEYFPYVCKNLAPGLEAIVNEQKLDYRYKAKTDLYHGTPAINPDGSVNALIEIPAGCNDKFETNEKGELFWDIRYGKPRFLNYLPHVGNYGMITNTKAEATKGGDGVALDVLVLGPSIARGSIIKIRLIGGIETLDSGATDYKMLAVPVEDTPANPFTKVKSYDELEKNGIVKILKTYFKEYKGKGAMKVKGFVSVKKSYEILDEMNLDKSKAPKKNH